MDVSFQQLISEDALSCCIRGRLCAAARPDPVVTDVNAVSGLARAWNEKEVWVDASLSFSILDSCFPPSSYGRSQCSLCCSAVDDVLQDDHMLNASTRALVSAWNMYK